MSLFKGYLDKASRVRGGIFSLIFLGTVLVSVCCSIGPKLSPTADTEPEPSPSITTSASAPEQTRVSAAAPSSTSLFSVYYPEPFDFIYPDETPENVSDALSMRATPGEFVPSTFAIKAGSSDLKEVRVEASDLVGESGIIGRDNIDVRVVKVWKQKDAPDLRYVGTILAGHPEIESRIDLDESSFEIPDILIEDEIYFDNEVVGHAWSRDNLPSIPHVGYARARIPADTLKQIWITVKVPEDAQSGVYQGNVTISVEPNPEAVLGLSLTVLPFTLVESDKNLFVALDYDYSSPLFDEAVEDIHDHGMNSIQLRRINLSDDGEFNAVRGLLAQYRLDKHVVTYNYPRTKSDVEKILNAGLNLYFYGIDEPWPKPPQEPYPCGLALQVELSRNIHEMGGKVVTQIIKKYADELSNPNSQLYADLETFDPATCRPFRGIQPRNLVSGSVFEPLDMSYLQIFFKRGTKYADTDIHDYIKHVQQDPSAKQSYPENYYYNAGYVLYPFENRLLYGFFLFNSRMDGVRAWTYQRTFGNPYDDFDGGLRGVQMGDVNLVYPSQEGLVPTYGWEAIREGINDLRYVESADALIREVELSDPETGSALRQRFEDTLAPFAALTYDDSGNDPWKKCDNLLTIEDLARSGSRLPTRCGNSKRIDELYHEKDLRIAREQIIDLVLEILESRPE